MEIPIEVVGEDGVIEALDLAEHAEEYGALANTPELNVGMTLTPKVPESRSRANFPQIQR